MINKARAIEKRHFLHHISSYLNELRVLTGVEVVEEDLSTIEQAQRIREEEQVLDRCPVRKFEIDFSELKSDRFTKYIQKLYESNSGQIYIWTDRTIFCGLYKVENIKDINFSFPFEINDNGVIVFLPTNKQDELLLDFFFNPSEMKVVEVEAKGERWSKIPY